MASRAHVLVVEDDRLSGFILLRLMTKLGCEVSLILDPHEVEKAIEQSRPQLIISDHHMLGRSGIEVLEMAKVRYPELRRCLASGAIESLGGADRARIEPCVLLGKPFDVDQLEVVLARLLAAHD